MEGKQKIAIVGAGGRLGAALLREYSRLHHAEVIGFKRPQLDLADKKLMCDKLDALDFDVLINCAAQTHVDRCESHPEEAFRLNAEAPRALAEICERKKAKLVHISTDYVFDGEKREPYAETDAARPISVYGESKRAGEQRIFEVNERHLVVRVSWVFGPDRPSFVDWALQRAREAEVLEAVADKFSTPTYTLDLAEMLLPFLSDPGAAGLWHLANEGSCSWQEYAQWAIDCWVAQGQAVKTRRVGALALRDMKNFIAKRPAYSVLGTAKYQQLIGRAPRHWRDAVAEYVKERLTQVRTS